MDDFVKCKWKDTCCYDLCVPEFCNEYEPVKMNNGDKLREMSDKELAGFLAGKFTDSTTQRMMEFGKMRSATEISAEADLWFRIWMQWLRTPVEDK